MAAASGSAINRISLDISHIPARLAACLVSSFALSLQTYNLTLTLDVTVNAAALL